MALGSSGGRHVIHMHKEPVACCTNGLVVVGARVRRARGACCKEWAEAISNNDATGSVVLLCIPHSSGAGRTNRNVHRMSDSNKAHVDVDANRSSGQAPSSRLRSRLLDSAGWMKFVCAERDGTNLLVPVSFSVACSEWI